MGHRQNVPKGGSTPHFEQQKINSSGCGVSREETSLNLSQTDGVCPGFSTFQLRASPCLSKRVLR